MRLNNKDIYKFKEKLLGKFLFTGENLITDEYYSVFDHGEVRNHELNLLRKASDQDIKNFLDKQLEAKLESIRRSDILLEIEEKVQAYQKQLMDEAGI